MYTITNNREIPIFHSSPYICLCPDLPYPNLPLPYFLTVLLYISPTLHLCLPYFTSYSLAFTLPCSCPLSCFFMYWLSPALFMPSLVPCTRYFPVALFLPCLVFFLSCLYLTLPLSSLYITCCLDTALYLHFLCHMLHGSGFRIVPRSCVS